MNRTERERLARLRRRVAHLELRIAERPDRDLSFDKGEASALKWAIDFIEGALGTEPDGDKEA